ncbi:MAG TPA: hypothetical protein VFB50_22470 [Chloroflexota bacterium]|nr:hypothetical protein [Chloroflexota bacterium]
MNGRVPTEEVEGLVEAVNRTGLKLGGAWINVSQFHPVELPETGAHVRLRVDAKGYIRELEVLGVDPRKTAGADRDDRIARLAVLKAAARFAADRQDIKSADVLTIAERWLQWVEG